MKNKALDSNLDFNGQGGRGYSRDSRMGVCANPYSIGDKALSQNVGMGPRHGNASSSPVQVGKPATKDALKKTIATASQGGRINGGATVKGFGNPDKINVGNR